VPVRKKGGILKTSKTHDNPARQISRSFSRPPDMPTIPETQHSGDVTPSVTTMTIEILPPPGRHSRQSSLSLTQQMGSSSDQQFPSLPGTPQRIRPMPTRQISLQSCSSEASSMTTKSEGGTEGRVKQKSTRKLRFNTKVDVYEYTPRPAIERKYTRTIMPAQTEIMTKLREVFVKLDVDDDELLSLSELQVFCEAVYDECTQTNVVNLMTQFTQDPMTGMNFAQWCNLLQATDPDIESFTDDLYEALILGKSTADVDVVDWRNMSFESSLDGGYEDQAGEPPLLVESPTSTDPSGLNFDRNGLLQDA